MASTFVPPRPDQWEPNSSQEAKPFVPPRPDQWEAPVGRVRTPQETEAVLRSRYPEAYKPTRSVTEQVLRGVGKTVGRDIHEGLTNMVDPYGGVQAIRDIANGGPRPPSAFEQATEPQGPGEEAGQIFTRGAEALATVPRALGSAITGGVSAIRGWKEGRAVSKAVQAERIRRMATEALDGPPQPPTRRIAPPPQTGSNNRTPPPTPPVTAAPPAQQGSNAPPIPPPRPQVAPPQQTGSNAPPVPPRRQAGPPAQQGSNNRTPPPAPTVETGPPTPPAQTPQAGPPTPPVAEPQAGPPQPPKPQGGAETPPPNTITTGAGRSAYDNAPGKFVTTDEVVQFAKANGVSVEDAAKGFLQAGNKVLDRGKLFNEIHDPRYGGVGGHPEIKAQFSKMYPNIPSMSQATPAQLATFLRQVILKQAMGEFAKGGVIIPEDDPWKGLEPQTVNVRDKMEPLEYAASEIKRPATELTASPSPRAFTPPRQPPPPPMPELSEGPDMAPPPPPQQSLTSMSPPPRPAVEYDTAPVGDTLTSGPKPFTAPPTTPKNTAALGFDEPPRIEWSASHVPSATPEIPTAPTTPKQIGSGPAAALASNAPPKLKAVLDQPAPPNPTRRIVVSLSDKALYLVENGKVVKRYSAMLGDASSPTPQGQFRIIQRIPWNGPVMGKAWMGFHNDPAKDSYYGIHGIGPQHDENSTSGCVGLKNEDVVDLFRRVSKGDPVSITGNPGPGLAKGGVIVPAGKERVRGMAHRWGPKGRRGQ